MRKLLDTKADASPTLFAVLTGEDKDVDTPLIAHIDNNLLDKVAMLVNKNVDIYNELNTTPPFPAWKDGLRDLWN